ADEQFTRTEPSPELRGELNKLLDSLYAQLIDGIATRRKLSPDAVKSIVDRAMLTASKANDLGLVDHLVDIDGMRDLIANQIDDKNGNQPPATSKGTSNDRIQLVHDYGRDTKDEPDMSNPFAFFTFLMKKPEVSDKPAVALIYA